MFFSINKVEYTLASLVYKRKVATLTSNFLASYIARYLKLSSDLEIEFGCPVVRRYS